jgi:hypothetical protein
VIYMPATVVQHPDNHAASIASEFLGQSDGDLRSTVPRPADRRAPCAALSDADPMCGGKGLKGLRVQGDILGLLSLDSHLVVLLKPG